MHSLNTLSPLDGRYQDKVTPLRAYFSESALFCYRIKVEIEYLIALKKPSQADAKLLRNIYLHYDSAKDGARLKALEKETNHDVKAVEYLIKEKLAKTPLKKYAEFVHIALTSEDVNNLSYGLMLRDAVKHAMIPKLTELQKFLVKKSKAWRSIPMLARTHGQPATPTTLGKEIFVYAKRLERQLDFLKKQQFLGKLNGATGTFAAHMAAYPEEKWLMFSARFIKSLGLAPNLVTTQIEPHDYQAELYHALARTNAILVDLARDVWLYISMNYFHQKTIAGEVGSSTMPHKVNPIDFENAEGNLGLANALLMHLASVLPLSRLQRDLTDSTVQRNIGTAFGYAYLAYASLARGLGKLEANRRALREDLDGHPEVLAEAIQTVMRRYGIEKPYEKLKALTRGKKITLEMLRTFIDSLDIPAAEKIRLRKLTPDTYIGMAAKLIS